MRRLVIAKLLKFYKMSVFTSLKLMTHKEVALYFNISPSTLYRWRKQGLIKAGKIGGRIYFRKSEVEAALITLKTPKK